MLDKLILCGQTMFVLLAGSVIVLAFIVSFKALFELAFGVRLW